MMNLFYKNNNVTERKEPSVLPCLSLQAIGLFESIIASADLASAVMQKQKTYK